jgi:predicted RND superfamily exporter protein
VSGSLDSLSEKLVPWLIRNRRPILWVALAFSIVGAFFSARLFGDLRSELEELLPKNAPSVVAAKEVGPKLHNVNQLSIIFDGKDGDALERLADDLVKKLQQLPPQMVERVEYRVDAEQRFGQQYGMFYLEKPDLESILQRVRARVAWEKQKHNALLDIVGDHEMGPAPPLDFSDIEKKYPDTSSLSHFRKGYFQSPDGHLLVILVRPPEAATGYEFNKHLLDTVKGLIAGLEPKKYDPAVTYGFDSEVTSLVEEQEALVADLASSTVVVLVFVLAVLWLYFRRVRAILAIAGSLAVGCAITFGLSYFLVGHLNANTAFLGSIVVGNGINVAIIVTARYREARRRHETVEQAILTAWRNTLAATFVAAFAAALSYLSLATTSFRGFNQFGLIGGIGMSLCWFTAFLLLPPLIAALEGSRPMLFGKRAEPHPWISAIVHFVERHSVFTRGLTVLLLVGSGLAVWKYKGPLIEYDVSKLRAQKSLVSGATYWGHKQDEVFRAYLTPIVIYGDTPDQLRQTVAVLNEKRQQLGAADPIREVRTLDTSLPKDAEQKTGLVEQIRDELTPARLELLPKDLQAKAELYRPPQPVRPPVLMDLPENLRLPLTTRAGEVGHVALAFPKKVGVLNQDEIEQLRDLVRGAIADSQTGARAVSQQLLFGDISGAITSDGPKATGLALLFVIVMVVGVFHRRVRPTLMTCGGLLLGVAFLIGAAAAAHVRINFLNFVVLPITFGIGVDYAVNIVQRYEIEGKGSLPRVLMETGGAVALCSSTTIIGYASLLVADNRALQGFGLLASLGELTCITAALVFLPAWIWLFDGRGPAPAQTQAQKAA